MLLRITGCGGNFDSLKLPKCKYMRRRATALTKCAAYHVVLGVKYSGPQSGGTGALPIPATPKPMANSQSGTVASLGRSDPVWSGGPPFLSRPRIGTNLRYQRRLDPWTGPAHHGTDGRGLPGRADDQLAAGSGYFYWDFLGSPLLLCGETPVWVDTPAEICGCWEPWPPRPPALSISKKRPTPWTPNR